MIIYGSRTISSTRGQGMFLCPLCKMQRPYRHVGNTRYFTLYFIPLFPIYSQGEHVECSGCGEGFAMEVLSMGAEIQSELQAAGVGAPSTALNLEDLRRGMLLILMQAQRTGPEQLGRLQNWCHSINLATNDQTLYQELQMAQQAAAQFAPFAQARLQALNHEQKKAFIGGARQVLCGQFRPTEMDDQALRHAAYQLGMYPQDVDALLN